MKMMLSLLPSIVCLFSLLKAGQGISVKTEYGPVEGFQFTTDSGFEANVFLGIPFAKPPVGDLRFEKPEAVDPWDEAIEAKTYKPACITQPDFLNKDGHEDCLYLNVIRPRTDSEATEGYPVMVFIHGGAYIIGSGYDSNYTKAAERVVSKGVVLVTIQYRLSALGFYSSGDAVAHGNYGLWDQIEALKFVKKTVRSFGGNPDAVTIFGESAGGGSTSILTLTKAAADLFVRSIPMSGTSQNIWALNDSPVRTSKKLNELLGCGGTALEQKLCMKKVPAEDLVQASSKLMDGFIPRDSMAMTYFNPRFDGDLIEQTTDLDQLYKKAEKKPTLVGLMSQEDIMFALKGPMSTGDAKWFPITGEKASQFTESDFVEAVHGMFSQNGAYYDRVEEALSEIIDFYSKHADAYTHHKWFQIFVQLFSDTHFNVGALREALRKQRAGHEVHFYVYDYTPIKIPLVDGAGHAMDMIGLWGGNGLMPDFPLTGDFAKAVHNLADVLTNFAKTGVPSASGFQAPQVDGKTIPFIHLNHEVFVGDDLWPERIQFWNHMADKYGWDWISGRHGKNHHDIKYKEDL